MCLGIAVIPSVNAPSTVCSTEGTSATQLSRNLEEMIAERGLEVDHSTINRWVLNYAPELDRRCRPYLKSTNDSWRVDETYVKLKKQWKSLYRAVDSEGNTLDFLLTAKRDTNAAKRFFLKVLKGTCGGDKREVKADEERD